MKWGVESSFFWEAGAESQEQIVEGIRIKDRRERVWEVQVWFVGGT
jgi:hypothetical protein